METNPPPDPPTATEHRDVLTELNKSHPLSEKLWVTHAVIRQQYDFIDRIAVATYDADTDLLKTFICSSEDSDPMSHYQFELKQSKSLQEILRTGTPRVVNDLTLFDQPEREHAKRIASKGYGSSYTMPMYMNGVFFGFVFFNSRQTHCFRPDVLHYLDLFGHLISLIVISGLTTFRTMLATLKAARDISTYRDMETGAHLDRMAHYARIIARGMADRHHFDDEFIEHIFLFSPLHDIGKIGVPDAILKKPDRLTAEEFETIKNHVIKGRQMIDAVLQDFGLDSVRHVNIMRNITEYHHEALNGTGYPHGIKGEAIPIEARIISVADIFDALTSKRPYKGGWTNDEAFAALREIAGTKLDPECVEALIRGREEIEKIQGQFKEELYS